MLTMDNIQIQQVDEALVHCKQQLQSIIGANVMVRFIVLDAAITEIEPEIISINTIIETVADYHKTSYNSITGKSRIHELKNARCMCYKLIIENIHPVPSLKSIGNIFSKRDHSTVINALKQFDNFYETEPFFKRRYNDLKELVHFKIGKNINNQ